MKRKEKLRRATGDALRNYRLLTRQTASEVAKELGWPLEIYASAEAGLISLSAGRRADFQRLLRSSIAKSAPAEIHYQGHRLYEIESTSEDDGAPTMVECGPLPPGDKVALPGQHSAVTCTKCRLTPAWQDAMWAHRRRSE